MGTTLQVADLGGNMTQQFANAYPRKNFFIQMFTKDIGLEDCILDLIDNSIDGLIRSRDIKLSDIIGWIFSNELKSAVQKNGLPVVRVDYSGESVSITDNCGGIDFDYALSEALNFGHGSDWKKGFLGVYGVGMKRALFKIGEQFSIKSSTLDNGFSCDLNVPDWLTLDNNMDDWRIPLVPGQKATNENSAGTAITISQLHSEVKDRLLSGTIEKSLHDSIAKTYSFFIGKYARIFLNGREVQPFKIPWVLPTDGSVSYEEFEQDGVTVRILASIAEPNEFGRLREENAGWYIVCNGRIVLAADKSKVTGWGDPRMPTFQPKHRRFVGLVFFESMNPLQLPWTTTKRDLNQESGVYMKVRGRMAMAARPILSFIDKSLRVPSSFLLGACCFVNFHTKF